MLTFFTLLGCFLVTCIAIGIALGIVWEIIRILGKIVIAISTAILLKVYNTYVTI